VFENMFNDLCPRISSVIIIYKYKIKVDAVANYINMSYDHVSITPFRPEFEKKYTYSKRQK